MTSVSSPSIPPQTNAQKPSRRRSLWSPVLVILVSLAPIFASYAAYYWGWRPQGHSNYGTLVEPQRDLPALALQDLQGQLQNASAWQGRFWLFTVAGGSCPPQSDCDRRLWLLRQWHQSLGKERDRVIPVWLINDAGTPPEVLQKALEQVAPRRVGDNAALAQWLQGQPEGAFFLVDPFARLMMVFPAQPDTNRMRSDVMRLLAASANWQRAMANPGTQTLSQPNQTP